MIIDNQDTIAAISTAQGEGAIGIVRLSGTRAIEIANTIWRSGRTRGIEWMDGYTMVYGHVVDPRSGEEVDEAILSVMRAPRSFTREDVVEISCHGGPLPLMLTLELVLEAGARIAEPGEYTKRAFLNGRIDLAQAEAVIDVIRAQTDRASNLAVRQLAGGLSAETAFINDKLLTTLAHLEAAVDFSDEDVNVAPRDSMRKACEKCAKRIDTLLESSHDGELIRAGVRLSIVGRPNVGKSSLLNALLERERAIVTSIPGTTRDVLEESVSIRGVPFVLADTAGIRASDNEAETIGVARSHRSLSDADIVLCVIDAADGIRPEDLSILEGASGKTTMVALNKIDLVNPDRIASIRAQWPDDQIRVVSVSALTGKGITNMKEEFVKAAFSGQIPATNEILVSNARHTDALRRALTSVRRAVTAIADGLSEEFASAEIRDAINAIGEITGTSVSEDVLERIFSEFCIGK